MFSSGSVESLPSFVNPSFMKLQEDENKKGPYNFEPMVIFYLCGFNFFFYLYIGNIYEMTVYFNSQARIDLVLQAYEFLKKKLSISFNILECPLFRALLPIPQSDKSSHRQHF